MKLLKKVIIAFFIIIFLPVFLEVSTEPIHHDLITQHKKAPSED